MDETEPAVEYVLDIDLGSNGGRLLARTIEDVEQWVVRERDFWSWLFEKPAATEVQNIASHVSSHLDRLNKGLTDWKTGQSDNHIFGSMLFDFYRNGKLLSSRTPGATLIESLRQEDGTVAASAALAVVLDIPFAMRVNKPVISATIFKGTARMTMGLAGVDTEAPQAIEKALRDISEQYEERLNSATKLGDSYERRLNQLVNSLSELEEKAYHQRQWP